MENSSPTSPDKGALRRGLRELFGHADFRAGQAEIVESVASGEDALVVMPTGAGKSLCYQLPAVVRGGTTLVVSPLIALMKDQVDALQAKGVRATCINSSISSEERRSRMAGLRSGQWQLAYVAPERFTPRFLETLRGVDIRLLAIDEAHCVSEWGHDFRPDYLRLGAVRTALNCPPTVALTATATPMVQADILNTLGIGEARRFVRGFDRENLALEVQRCRSARDKQERLPEILSAGTSIVYCATRKSVERVTQYLRESGVPAGMYHGGMLPDARTRVQDAFMQGDVPVVVATNAFGMGIDKSNIRAIVHFDIPGTVEAYYQEIGRAGRDGRPSRVVAAIREVYEALLELWRKQPDQAELLFSLEAFAEGLSEEVGGARGAASCLRLLRREGVLRRIHPSDQPARIALLAREGTPPRGLRGNVLAAVRARLESYPGERLVLKPEVLCRELEIERVQLSAALTGLGERGWIAYEAPQRVGGVELLEPGAELKIDDARIQERRGQELAKLDKMVGYVDAGCRRRYLIEYFGETAPYERCGSCDGCRSGRPLRADDRALSGEEEIEIRKMLSCVARMGEGWTAQRVAEVLAGSRSQALKRLGFDRLSTYGILRHRPVSELVPLLEALTEVGLLDRRYVTRPVRGMERTYAVLALTDLGRSVMRDGLGDRELAMPAFSRRAAAPTRSADLDLLAYLKEVRRKLAQSEDVPAYVIAPNRTLEAIAEARPVSRNRLEEVHGMGPSRMRRYGDALLDAVRAWTGGNAQT